MGGSSEEGREEKGLKGSEEERKRLLRVWFFCEPSPRRL